MNLAARGRCVKDVRPRIDNINVWNDDQFFVQFRLIKPTVLHLLPLVEPSLEMVTGRFSFSKAIYKLQIACAKIVLDKFIFLVRSFCCLFFTDSAVCGSTRQDLAERRGVQHRLPPLEGSVQLRHPGQGDEDRRVVQSLSYQWLGCAEQRKLQ
jgi:hypothetical protein